MTETAPLALIIPCYNEAQRLDTDAFLDFATAANDTYLLFVDDGSADNTVEVLEGMRTACPSRVHVLKLPQNQGKAEAVRQGISYALEHFRPAQVGFWDADLATPLDAVERFRSVLHSRPDIDMIFGARVQLLGRYVKRSAVRHYLGRIFATAVSIVLEIPIYDTQCGAKLFRVGPETASIFSQPFLSKWVFDVEILARYRRFYLSCDRKLSEAVYEYPLECWVDVAGSKVRPADFFVAFRDVVRIRLAYFR
ncbi:MAG TPA: glycosyltransferase [Bryobacteraceae bacterium]|jgi:glycosyltransferase involved in cell wall biosynthesis|nr:glycosyltransferase [Bryobacteraceae bacterium]